MRLTYVKGKSPDKRKGGNDMEENYEGQSFSQDDLNQEDYYDSYDDSYGYDLDEYDEGLSTEKEYYDDEREQEEDTYFDEEPNEDYEENYEQNVDKFSDMENFMDEEITHSDNDTLSQTKLGNYYADEIISLGDEDMNEVLNELLHSDNLDTTSEVLLNRLSSELSLRTNENELRNIGKDPSVLRSDDFINFAKYFRDDVPLMDVYNVYESRVLNNEQNTYSPAGSLKDNKKPGGIKDYYTADEVDDFTVEDFKRNPKLLDIVNRSIERW